MVTVPSAYCAGTAMTPGPLTLTVLELPRTLTLTLALLSLLCSRGIRTSTSRLTGTELTPPV